MTSELHIIRSICDYSVRVYLNRKYTNTTNVPKPLNPVPAGYPALISGNSPVSENFARFFPNISSKKCISKILKCIVFDQF